jgi:hypothetical protein
MDNVLNVGLDSQEIDVSRICKLMEAYVSKSDDWQKYAHFDPFRYTRNLVDDGNGRFNLLILCWGPGQVRYGSFQCPENVILSNGLDGLTSRICTAQFTIMLIRIVA